MGDDDDDEEIGLEYNHEKPTGVLVLDRRSAEKKMSSNYRITQLLESATAGDRDAAESLFVIVYDELRRLADGQMRNESSDHTLQSTALVHEVWLKLVGNQEEPAFKNRGHFFSAAAQAMRRILVDSARARKRLKRGGEHARVELREDELAVEGDSQMLALDEALKKLHEKDELKATLVELRYFGGLTNAQAAEQLGISSATADRYWAFARAWLRAKIEE